MRVRIDELRDSIRNLIEADSDPAPKKPKREPKPTDPTKMVGKVVTYLGRPLRVLSVFTGQNDWGNPIYVYKGTFDDEERGHIHTVPAERTSKYVVKREKQPVMDSREFLEQDIDYYLKSDGQDGRPNIYTVRDRWKDITKELSWMEKYIFDNKWLNSPMAKSNEQLAQELDAKLPIVRAAETRAFYKIERFLHGNNEAKLHDLDVVRQARAMVRAEEPMAKIVVFLRSELNDKNIMNKLDFLQ